MKALPSFSLLFLTTVLSAGSLLAAGTTRVSLGIGGAQADGNSEAHAITPDGRFVVFESAATNLVAEDSNAKYDIFIHDRTTAITELVSITSSGQQADADCRNPAVSADGRFIAFWSTAANLVTGDSNGCADVFVKDRQTLALERVSVSSAGAQGNADSGYRPPSISGDGRYVLFASYATNLVPSDLNETSDIFLRDRESGTTELVSRSSLGEQANFFCDKPVISADGSCVAFLSSASNLIPEPTMGYLQVFARDLQAGTTELISRSSSGDEGNWDSAGGSGGIGRIAISGDGRFVAFDSLASNLVAGDTNDYPDIFVRDRQEGTTERVSTDGTGAQGEYFSYLPAITPDGRFVAFVSAANLVPGDEYYDYDVYVKDRTTGETWRASVGPGGAESTSECYDCAISAHAGSVAFEATDGNLVPGDTNQKYDIFVYNFSSFADVGPGHWAFSEIEACVEAGIVSGYDDGLYHPESAVTRDQMAVYVSRALAGGDDNVPGHTGDPTFPDVLEGFWALDYVEFAVDQNVVGGYEDGTYHPEYQVTRDQMAVYVARALVAPSGEAAVPDPGCTAPPFPDVPCDFWARKHVQHCMAEGVVQGYDDGHYHPEYVVTRDQMAVYVARAFDLVP